MGLMQHRPLMISSLLRHAAAFNGAREIVSRTPDGKLERHGFAALDRRARALAAALARLGVRQGDRVATLAWNTRRHLEAFYGAPGLGAVLHTINPRLFDEQIVYIANHAEDRVLFFDPDLYDLVARLAPKLRSIERFVVLGAEADMPRDAPFELSSYDELVGAAPTDPDFQWPAFDERAASILCYTSGTTGMPKGVLCSHRSVVLHALYAQSPLAFGLTPFDVVLLVVPMFHAYGWSLPFVTAIAGAKLVLPGPAPTPSTIVDLIHAEQATLATGVPTVWSGVFDELDKSGRDLGGLKRALIGGSAIPPVMSERLRKRHGVDVVTGWGMTELSPVGTFTCATPESAALPEADRERAVYGNAGRILYPLEIKVVDAAGNQAPRDGVSAGDIWVRGPCVASGYFRGEGGDVLDAEGWFPTGDIGAVGPDGAVTITDRYKDLIKSGGEWISSTELEAAAASCPGVVQAAAIAAPHPKWQERPILLYVAQAGVTVRKEAVLDAMSGRLARWQLPDDLVQVDALPLTAAGKIDKKVLRERYKNHLA
jgi:fatty-acyl-CoA synthase